MNKFYVPFVPEEYLTDFENLSAEEFESHISDITKEPRTERIRRMKAWSYLDGQTYAEVWDPEMLTPEQINNSWFIKGYNKMRKELGKEPYDAAKLTK